MKVYLITSHGSFDGFAVYGIASNNDAIDDFVKRYNEKHGTKKKYTKYDFNICEYELDDIPVEIE